MPLPKLLALDVDGTLVRRDGSIRDDDRAAIERLQQRGIPITIVTGRLYSGTAGVARDIGIQGPVACVDGSHIVDTRGDKSLYQRGFRGEHAKMVRDILARARAASFLFAEDAIIHDPLGEPFAGYVRTWSPNVHVVERVEEHRYWDESEVMAVVSVGPERDILDAVASLEKELEDEAFCVTFPVVRIQQHAMVVRAKGPTKGTAIAELAAFYGCSSAEVVAVGDWINDIPMFRAAGRSFVMPQAPDVVKATASDVLAGSADGGGVAEAILRAWGPLS